MKKRISSIVAFSITLFVVLLGFLSFRRQGSIVVAIPSPFSFGAMETGFAHIYDPHGLPFAGGSAIDSDGDGIDELFFGGGKGQASALLVREEGGGLVNRASETGLDQVRGVYGSLSIDADRDGDVDLFAATEDGLTLLGNDGGIFTSVRIPLPLTQGVLPVTLTAADLNRDGYPDLLVGILPDTGGYRSGSLISLEENMGLILLMSDGPGVWSEATAQAGLSGMPTMSMALFIDLDDDGRQDLVLAPQNDAVRVLRNSGSGIFLDTRIPSRRGAWLSIAAGDIDNDRDMDLLFTNAGVGHGSAAIQRGWVDDGQMETEWKLLRNDGDFTFTDQTAAAGLLGMGFARGAAIEDFDGDGLPDIVAVQNAIDDSQGFLDPEQGIALHQEADGRFRKVDAFAPNPSFGMTPIIASIDGDGHADLSFANLDGPARVFLNTAISSSVSVRPPDSPHALGVRITVASSLGNVTKQFVAGGAFCGDHSSTLTFPVSSGSPANVTVRWPGGEERRYEAVQPGGIIVLE